MLEHAEAYSGPCKTLMMEPFYENSQRLKTFNYFFSIKAQSKLFDKVLNTPLTSSMFYLKI